MQPKLRTGPFREWTRSARRKPEPRPGRLFTTLVTGVAILLTARRPAAAQHPVSDTLRLPAALEAARSANPMLQAARLRGDAAAERVAPAGALPDPQLTLGLMNRPLDGFGTAEPMTMNQVQLSQMIPWPGTLSRRRDEQRHLALAASLDSRDLDAQVAARVAVSYYRVAYLDRALVRMAATRGLLRDFLQTAQTRYTVGTGLQQDVLQAQVAVARMTADIATTEAERLAVAARLNALLGRGAQAAVPALDLPETTLPLPAPDSLMTLAVARRPALEAARARIDAADAAYRAARRASWPDLMIAAAYGQRPQYTDMATLMLGISLPLRTGARQTPERNEMLALRSMREAEARDLSNEIFAQITELRAEAERARTLVDLYRTDILPQAQAAVESALASYRVGQVDYMTLLDSEMTLNRYAVERYRLLAEYHGAVARVEAVVGGRLEEM
ncbi:MAG: TolC family protein [Gemmatimonadales bacterium]